jgi:guanylate kinase
MEKGNIFVISAPSGAGKSSLVKALCAKDNSLQVSISHTTRTPRMGEVDGVNYYFISHDNFAAMLQQNKFIEHAVVYENFYGTHIDTINNLHQQNVDIILEIDIQGAMQVKKIFPHATLIFILPPNLPELERRLRSRNTDSEDTIVFRLSKAKDEIMQAKHFDYAVINDNFNDAISSIYSIIMVQRLKAQKVLSSYKF